MEIPLKILTWKNEVFPFEKGGFYFEHIILRCICCSTFGLGNFLVVFVGSGTQQARIIFKKVGRY